MSCPTYTLTSGSSPRRGESLQHIHAPLRSRTAWLFHSRGRQSGAIAERPLAWPVAKRSEGRGLVWIGCRAQSSEWFGVGQRWWLRVIQMPAGCGPGDAAVGVVGDRPARGLIDLVVAPASWARAIGLRHTCPGSRDVCLPTSGDLEKNGLWPVVTLQSGSLFPQFTETVDQASNSGTVPVPGNPDQR